MEGFAAEFGLGERRHWCGMYLEGLLREGESKAIEPLAARLSMPAEWTEDPARMTRAGVLPDRQVFGEKWGIALELPDEMKPQLPAYRALVFDAAYGVIPSLLAELEKRGEPHVAQVPGNIAAWPMDAVAAVAQAGRGRPAKRAKVQDAGMQPPTMTARRDRLMQQPAAWREAKLPCGDVACVRAVALRVQASQRKERSRQP